MTKERLRNYQDLKREYEQLRQQLEEIEAKLYYPKIHQLTDIPGAGQKHGNPQEVLTIRYIELQECYRAKMEELAAKQLAVESAFEGLDPDKRMLMRYRYIDGLKWDEVCARMNYGWTQIHYHHGEALKRLKEMSE